MNPILLDLPSELIGERVVVRPYRAGDGPALFAAVHESRDHILPWLPWADNHPTVEDSETFVRRCHARWALREDLGLGIWDGCSGGYLGGTGLHRIDWEVRSFEIGYWIRASAEGKGYVTEAVTMLLGMAFETLSARRVFIRCASGNTRSAAVPRRLGFVQEGTLRNDIVDTNGKPWDTLVFGMTPDDWSRVR